MVRRIETGLKKEQIQQKAVEMELIRQEMQKLDQQLIILETRKTQLLNIKDGFKNMKGDEDILIPLGPGFLTKGKLSKDRSIIMEIGANMAIEKNAEDAEDIIDRNIKELDRLEIELKSNLLEMSEKMQKYQDMLLQYYG